MKPAQTSAKPAHFTSQTAAQRPVPAQPIPLDAALLGQIGGGTATPVGRW